MLHHSNESDEVCYLCLDKLQTAHVALQEWFKRKKAKYPNIHVSWAYRDAEDQMKAFLAGTSRLQYPDSPHNKLNQLTQKPESLALDVFQIDEDGIGRFSPKFYLLLNAENEMDNEPILWGGKFKTLGDYDHYQLK